MSYFKRISVLVLFGCLVVAGICVTRAVAASPSGTVEGIVSDKDDVAIPEAQVELDDAATGVTRDITTTNDTGGYEFHAVAAGKYVVKISGDGFLPRVIKDVVVGEGKTVTLVKVKLQGK